MASAYEICLKNSSRSDPETTFIESRKEIWGSGSLFHRNHHNRNYSKLHVIISLMSTSSQAFSVRIPHLNHRTQNMYCKLFSQLPPRNLTLGNCGSWLFSLGQAAICTSEVCRASNQPGEMDMNWEKQGQSRAYKTDLKLTLVFHFSQVSNLEEEVSWRWNWLHVHVAYVITLGLLLRKISCLV